MYNRHYEVKLKAGSSFYDVLLQKAQDQIGVGGKIDRLGLIGARHQQLKFRLNKIRFLPLLYDHHIDGGSSQTDTPTARQSSPIEAWFINKLAQAVLELDW